MPQCFAVGHEEDGSERLKAVKISLLQYPVQLADILRRLRLRLRGAAFFGPGAGRRRASRTAEEENFSIFAEKKRR